MMDPALLKEREAFLKRAKSQPTVEKRKAKTNSDENAKKSKPSKPPQPKTPKVSIDYKTAQGTSQYRFSVLARIVKHMKTRHQVGDTEPLLLDEVLDETNQLDVSVHIRHWLGTEALVNNPKIAVKESSEGRKFAFKPKLDIRDRKGLMRLLKSYDLVGKGGVLMEDVEESLPNAQKAVKNLGEHIVVVSRPVDKKKVLFYNDKDVRFQVQDGEKIFGLIENELQVHNIPWENCISLGSDNANVMVGRHQGVYGHMLGANANIFSSGCVCHLLHIAAETDYKKMWRSVAVEGLDEAKIEEYLTRSGISSMQDAGIRKVSAVPRRKKGAGKRKNKFKRHNDHLEDVLKDYSEMTNKT